jgi:hypothetical protein
VCFPPLPAVNLDSVPETEVKDVRWSSRLRLERGKPSFTICELRNPTNIRLSSAARHSPVTAAAETSLWPSPLDIPLSFYLLADSQAELGSRR